MRSNLFHCKKCQMNSSAEGVQHPENGIDEIKSDLRALRADLVKWIVGTAIGLGVAGITVMTFVLNNAAPKAPVAPAQQPIIINIPAQPAK